MTTQGHRGWFAGAALAAALLICGMPAAADAQSADEVRHTVRASGLDDAGKARLLGSTDRALAAGVPAEDIAVIVKRGLERSGRGETIAGMLDTAASAKEKGLPVRPILDRTQQGLAKGVPAETVAAASKRLGEKLAAAQPLVNDAVKRGVRMERERDRDAAVESVARALERNVGADTIARTGERVGERKGSLSLFDESVHTITRLTDAGLSQEAAARIVQGAVERGRNEKDLMKLERTVAEDLKKGRRADDAARSAEQELRQDRQNDDRSRGSDRRDDPGKGSGSGKGRDSGPDRTKDSSHGGKGKN